METATEDSVTCKTKCKDVQSKGPSSKQDMTHKPGDEIEDMAVDDCLPTFGVNNEESSVAKTIVKNDNKNLKVELYSLDTGPKLYPVAGNIITPTLITKNLPEAFKYLPIFGRPKSKNDLEDFYERKVREYVGCDFSDSEFAKLANFCSPDNLKTGQELKMPNSYPTAGPLATTPGNNQDIAAPGDNLCIVKKLKLRLSKDIRNHYPRKLKYRGLRILPMASEDEGSFKVAFQPLQPGKDLVFKVRVYRPFYSTSTTRSNARHSLFNNDIVLLGRQSLAVLRDRIICPNDVGTRIDVSADPDRPPTSSAKELFPSGFLFINNVFYVDTRPGCEDRSAGVRAWAAARGLGDFPRRSLDVPLDQVPLRLGHPEVYLHQGCCEHLFTFSEVRLLRAADPARAALFPLHSAIAQNQTLYCTTCAEFGARWVVTGCARVPFDPAFFCETCLRLYLYRDGRKVGDFKAYPFRGNELNVLRPLE